MKDYIRVCKTLNSVSNANIEKHRMEECSKCKVDRTHWVKECKSIQIIYCVLNWKEDN